MVAVLRPHHNPPQTMSPTYLQYLRKAGSPMKMTKIYQVQQLRNGTTEQSLSLSDLDPAKAIRSGW